MTQHVLISYRWEKDRPEEKWLFWLKKTLEQKGFHVTISELRTLPMGRDWVSDLQTIYGIRDSRVYKVPHDPGCLTILSYLESLSHKKVEETVLLVATVGETPFSDPAKQKESTLKLESTKKVGFLKRTLGHAVPNSMPIDNGSTRLVILYSSLGPLLSPQAAHKKLPSL
jgi:predicted alpha/beta hydrolase family esterase